MGKIKKKGVAGNAKAYLTRNEALRKLQISLQDFRRLCILKGIFPREPRKKVKGTNKTYYMTKDIMFLYHEPLLAKFREIRAFERKIKKAVARRNLARAKHLNADKPYYTIYHVIRERYPSFVDALRDLDDALTMIHLFAVLPQTEKIMQQRTQNCMRLAREFQLFCAKTNALKKTFVSVKGYYYQAEVQGQEITWIVPHQFSQEMPLDVDYRVMLTFLEFYETLLNFVNYKLYHSLDLHYPPKLDERKDAGATGFSAFILQPASQVAHDAVVVQDAQMDSEDLEKSKKRIKTLKSKLGKLERAAGEEEDDDESMSGLAEEEEEERELDARDGATMADEFAVEDGDEETQQRRKDISELESFKSLFSGMYFFIAREVPRHSVEFVARCFGAEVGWEGESSPFTVDDERVTHHIVDRPVQAHRFLTREYVQPQWVFDSVNMKKCLSVHKYTPGGALPPHLSPFVNEESELYNPTRMLAGEGDMDRAEAEADESVEDGTDDEQEQYQAELAAEAKGVAFSEMQEGAANKGTKRAAPKEETEEDLAKMMMSKKNKRLYGRMMHGINKKKDEAENLKKKREVIDQTARKAKVAKK